MNAAVIKRMPSLKLLLLMPTPVYVYESLGILDYTTNISCLIILARRGKMNLKCKLFI